VEIKPKMIKNKFLGINPNPNRNSKEM
jgi:hypothetical protein